jgi:hypothetical protein
MAEGKPLDRDTVNRLLDLIYKDIDSIPMWQSRTSRARVFRNYIDHKPFPSLKGG